MSLVPKSATYIKVCFYFAFLAVFRVIPTVNKPHTSKYFFKLLPYDIIDISYCLRNISECLTTFVYIVKFSMSSEPAKQRLAMDFIFRSSMVFGSIDEREPIRRIYLY